MLSEPGYDKLVVAGECWDCEKSEYTVTEHFFCAKKVQIADKYCVCNLKKMQNAQVCAADTRSTHTFSSRFTLDIDIVWMQTGWPSAGS